MSQEGCARIETVRGEPVEPRTVSHPSIRPSTTLPAGRQGSGRTEQRLLASATEALQLAGVPRPRWTAEQLLSHRLGCRPIELYLEPPPAGPDQITPFQADVAARAAGMPLQYLLGTAGFYGREFFVGPGVFIPRPETEILVEVVLSLLSAENLVAPVRAEPFGSVRPEPCLPAGRVVEGRTAVIDVGTGSGAIAVTLALERPGILLIATDRSATALSFAHRNAQRYEASVSFIQGNLAEMLAPRSVDLIVANLPYLNPEESSSWPRELAWEPRLSLDGGEGGLSFIERLIGQAASVLKPHGRLVLEIGAGQGRSIGFVAGEHSLGIERIVDDLAGLERVMVLGSRHKE